MARREVSTPRHRRRSVGSTLSPSRRIYRAAAVAGFTASGWGNASVHMDTGKKRWWTYDDAGKHMSGAEKMKYLHKAPDNFKKDWGLK